MRAIFLAFVLTFAWSARAEEAKLPESAQACFDCHDKGGDGPEVDRAAFVGSVHVENGVSCADCHEGYTPEHAMGGELPSLDAAQQELLARVSKGAWPTGEGGKEVKVHAPRAYLSCQNCHP